MIKKLLISLFVFGIAWGQSNGIKPPLGTQLDLGQKLTRGLVGAWFNQEAAPALGTLYDLSGNGNHGELKGDAYSVPGKDGPALQFDGAGDYITVGTVPISGYPFSIVTYANPTGIAAESVGTILSMSNFSSSTIYYLLSYYQNASNGWRIVARNATFRAAAHGSASTGWDHVVAVFESAIVRKLYVNGVFSNISTNSVSFNSSIDTVTIGMLGRSSAYTTGPFEGPISSVKLYNRALGEGEIEELYRDRNILFKTQNIALIAAAGAAPPAEVGQLIMVGSVSLIVVFVAFSFWYSGREAA